MILQNLKAESRAMEMKKGKTKKGLTVVTVNP